MCCLSEDACYVLLLHSPRLNIAPEKWWQTFLLGRSIFWGVSCTEGIRLVPIPISTLISVDLGVDSSSEIAWFECSEEKILEKKNTLPETNMAPEYSIPKRHFIF